MDYYKVEIMQNNWCLRLLILYDKGKNCEEEGLGKKEIGDCHIAVNISNAKIRERGKRKEEKIRRKRTLYYQSLKFLNKLKHSYKNS